MIKTLTAAAAAELANSAQRIFVGGCTSEPVAILDVVAADPDFWQKRILAGAFIPGVNDRDLSALGRNTTVEAIFITAGLRADRAAGNVAHLPLHYSALWSRMARPGIADMAIITVPPMRKDGSFGLGLTQDFAPAVLAAGARLIGVVNPNMPDVLGGATISAARFEAIVESDAPLSELPVAEPDAISRAIAAHVVEQIPQAGTLQLGLGKIQGAVLEVLRQQDRRDVGYHAGMISDGVLNWVDEGGFGEKTSGISTGVALGTRGFYDRLAQNSTVRFRSVNITHSLQVLSVIPSLISVNSVLQLDLTGQANGEYVAGRQMSGQGGMVDFIRGARASTGGRAILALPATARNGTISRIVPTLSEGTPVSVSRADVDMVITEFGIADLREASINERAERLIAIAAPTFRDTLTQDWRDMQRRAAS